MPHVSWPFGGKAPTDLEPLIRRREQRVRAQLGSHTRVVLGIAVEHRDGMSWCAIAARNAIVSTSAAKWNVRSVSGSEDRRRGPLQELVALVGGERPVRRAARTSGLVPELNRDWGWSLAVAVAASASGAATALLTRTAGQPKLAVGAGIALAVAAASAAFANRIFSAQIGPLLGPRARRKLNHVLGTELGDQAVEKAFLDELRPHLRPKKRRGAVVIDSLEGLRPRARNLVLSHLRDPGGPGEEELWVILELRRRRRPAGSGREPLNAAFLASLVVFKGIDLWRCRVQPLALQEKRELLLSSDRREPSRNDPRLRIRGIADVADPSRADDTATEEELRAHLANIEPDAVRAFALLALAAAVPAPAAVSAGELATIAREAKASRGAPLSRLLMEWFPADSRNPTAIAEAINRVARECSELLDGSGSRRANHAVRIAAPYADMLRAHHVWASYDLPSQDHGHAFWALLWSRRLGARWHAAPAERLITHVRELREPIHVRSRYGAQTAIALFDAALEAVEAALALSVPGLGPEPTGNDELDGAPRAPLLEQARLLMPPARGSSDHQRRQRLLTAAWVTHALTADSTLLETISAATFSGDRAPNADDPLLQLHLELVCGAQGEKLVLPSAAHSALLDHARARATWFAEIARPLPEVTTSGVSKTTWLASAVNVDSTHVAGVAERTCKRLRAASTDSAAEALDHVTMIFLSLWQTLIEHREGALPENFDTLLQEATRVALERVPVRTHFVLEGLRRQLDATLRATEVVRLRKPAGDAVARLAGALSELDALHVMWQNLESYELADICALSRNVLRFMAGPDKRLVGDAEKVGEYLVGIGELHDGTPHRVAAELLVGCSRLSHSVEAASVPLVAAARTAINAGLGTRLTLDLCEAVLWKTQVSGASEREPLLAHLLRPGHRRAEMFHVPDEQAWNVGRMLFSCVTDTSSASAALVRDAVRERSRSIGDEWWADRLEQEVEWHEAFHNGPPETEAELAALLSRWHDRVWGGEPPAGAGTRSPRPHGYDHQSRELYIYVVGYLWAAVDRSANAIFDHATRLILENDMKSIGPGMVLLALKLVSRLDRGPDSPREAHRRALTAMRNGIHDAERSLAPDTNRIIYDRLSRDDPAFRPKAEFWRAEEERIHEERLFHHVAEGRYFEVFWHHYNRAPELPCDTDRIALEAELDGSRATVPQKVGGPLPEPLIFGDRGVATALSGQFIRLGHQLFHGPDGSLPGSDDDRAAIERAAHRDLPGLYGLLIEHADISEPLREMYRRQRRRFEEEPEP